MDWTHRCIAIIPCLNEADTIGPLITEVRRLLATVLVVDDGSDDGTAERAKAAGAEVIHHDSPLGKGAALSTGWRRACELEFEWVLMLDGDGQHAPADIPGFLAAAELDQLDLVVGNRFADPRGMPWLRRRVNQFMSTRLSRLTGRELPDSQCGFRMMRLAAWSQVRLETTAFEIESEMLVAFARAGFRIGFVPVQVIYSNERSKIRPVRDAIRWFGWMRRMRTK